LDILFRTEKLRNECNNQQLMTQRYGKQGAKRLSQRLADLAAATTLAMMKSLPGNCHELTGDRKGQLAMSLEGGKRLIFEAADEPVPSKDDGGLDWSQVTAIRILGIEDYHL
jgi:proteic killer suppression protein